MRLFVSPCKMENSPICSFSHSTEVQQNIRMLCLDLGQGIMFSSVQFVENDSYVCIHIYIEIPLTDFVWRLCLWSLVMTKCVMI